MQVKWCEKHHFFIVKIVFLVILHSQQNNMKNNEELRIEFAKIALGSLAHNVLDSNFQKAAKSAELESDELIAAYCWQLADSMMKLQ